MGFGQTISWHQACMNSRSVSCTEVTVPVLWCTLELLTVETRVTSRSEKE